MRINLDRHYITSEVLGVGLDISGDRVDVAVGVELVVGMDMLLVTPVWIIEHGRGVMDKQWRTWH